ncbi:hypothetical protein AGMMS50239_12070 [Bacteroidia bacterium]|nr:hypothetical protein AGMMS50239_12070 [Bacteroidia bacterium]
MTVITASGYTFFILNFKTMKQTSLLTVFYLLLIQVCTGQELPDYTLKDVPIVVDLDSIPNIQFESLKFNNIQYIPLETSEECLIGHADKTLIRNNRIYVADFHVSIALFVFDMNGKFLFKISKFGQGPSEYVSFRDFDIQSNGDIFMFDHFGKKFLVFNQDGKFLHDIRTDYAFSSFCIVKDKLYWANLYDSGKKFSALAVYNMSDKKIGFLLKNRKFLMGADQYSYVSYKFFSSPPDITYYSPRFSDIIYAIDDRGIHPFIGIKGKNLRLPPEHIIREWDSKMTSKNFFDMSEDKLYFKENTHIYETDRYIVLRCINGAQFNTLHLIYNKQSGTFSSTLTLFFYIHFCSNGPMGSTGKEFFSVINFNPDNKEHKKLLESREELKNWKEEDNPVIVLYDLDM